MEIQILTALIGEVSYQRGQIVDLPDELATEFIKAGHAVLIAKKPIETANNKTIVEKRSNVNQEKSTNTGK